MQLSNGPRQIIVLGDWRLV